jgi:hypothetical protein
MYLVWTTIPATKTLNTIKQPWTSDKGWSSSLGVGQGWGVGATVVTPHEVNVLWTVTRSAGFGQFYRSFKVWNFVFHSRGRTQTGRVWKKKPGVEVNISTQGVESGEAGGDCMMSIITCTLHHILWKRSNKGGWDRQDM